jgi:hypothetical protein
VRAEDHLCERQSTCAEVWHGNSVRTSLRAAGKWLEWWISFVRAWI